MKNIVPVLMMFIATSVNAHDFWIWPSNYTPEKNEKVEFTLEVGQDLSGNTMPRIDDWFSRFTVAPPSGIEAKVMGELGDDPAGFVKVNEEGLYTVAYRSTRSYVALKAKKFKGYLKDEGLEWVITDRRQRGESDAIGSEFYSRAAKSLIQQGEGDFNHFDVVTGMALEIIPLSNPYRLISGDSLKVKVFYQSKPMAGLLVEAFTRGAPTQREKVRTNESGIAEITLNKKGDWLIKTVHMIRLENEPLYKEDGSQEAVKVDWESFWASLTFQL